MPASDTPREQIARITALVEERLNGVKREVARDRSRTHTPEDIARECEFATVPSLRLDDMLALLAILSAPPVAGEAPPSRMAASSEGWVLAPAEPTQEMKVAGKQAVGWHAAPELFAQGIYRAMLAARPDAGRVDAETIGDVSSLIAARCVALPGKLIDCPVCGAVDRERERLASVAVPVSEEMEAALEWWCVVHSDPELFHECEQANERLLAARGAALAVPDKGGQGDQGSSGGLGQPGSGSQPGADVVATAALAIPPLKPDQAEYIAKAMRVQPFDPSVVIIGRTAPAEEDRLQSCWNEITSGATASTTSASGNEQVAASVVQPIRDEPDDTQASTGGAE